MPTTSTGEARRLIIRRKPHQCSFYVASKYIPCAPFGANQFGIVRVGLDFTAQAQNLYVDRAVVDIIVQPTGIEQLIARQNLARRTQKSHQQRILAVGQFYPFAFG